MRAHRTALVAIAVSLGVLAACSSSSGGSGSPGTTAAPTTAPAGTKTTTTVAGQPGSGPSATISGPLTGGKGIALAAANPGPALAEAGYTESEYEASGTAASYAAVGALPGNGRFHLAVSGHASYATRIVVRRPAKASSFNGTVVVEWLNVSGGADAAPDYTYLADEIVRAGYAWVGVSAQRIGIEGGPVAVQAPGADITGAGRGIRALDPARYSALHHPGDAFSYDIFTQVAQALRKPGKTQPLAGLAPTRVLAAGESQSAFALTTYVDGVQPLTHEFDGFLIHSRGAAAAPLGQPGAGIDIAGTLGGRPTRIRTDVDVPVIMVETETDVLGLIGYLPAAQPDTDRIRTWEVAGTSHADEYQIGAIEPLLGCKVPINRGQQSFVLRSALAHLDAWSRTGTAPPKAARLDLTKTIDAKTGKPSFVVDADGNVEGGIRTPSVDAPVDRLSGLAPADSSVICILMGATTALPKSRLAARYPSRAAYLADYAKAADRAIRAGFVLAADRTALLADAQPDRID